MTWSSRYPVGVCLLASLRKANSPGKRHETDSANEVKWAVATRLPSGKCGPVSAAQGQGLRQEIWSASCSWAQSGPQRRPSVGAQEGRRGPTLGQLLGCSGRSMHPTPRLALEEKRRQGPSNRLIYEGYLGRTRVRVACVYGTPQNEAGVLS